MDFARYNDELLAMATELANSGEEMAAAEGLRAFLLRHRMSQVGALTTTDVAAVVALRERVQAVFASDDLDAAVELVNALLRGAGTLPQLAEHDGEALHVHYAPTSAAIAHRLGAEAGMALALVLLDSGLERLKSCAAPDCADVFVDASRNRSRRYCDDRTCGNRLHVAAYRARRRGEA